MIKPDFIIAPGANVDREWQDCRLVVEVNEQHFHYVVLDASSTLVALKYYQFTAGHYREMMDNLTEIFREDPLLKEDIKESLVLFNWPESCLVPAAFYDETVNTAMIELVHGDLNKGAVLNDKINALNLYNIYRIPLEVKDFFSRQFPAGKYAHVYTIWLKCLQKEKVALQEGVTVIFYPKKILVMVIAGGQLQLVQNFEYLSAEDIAGHLLQVYQQFGLKQEETPLHLGGMIDLKSALYQELLKYFLLVVTEPLPPGLNLPEDFHLYPDHFFSPFLKMAVCGL